MSIKTAPAMTRDERKSKALDEAFKKLKLGQALTTVLGGMYDAGESAMVKQIRIEQEAIMNVMNRFDSSQGPQF